MANTRIQPLPLRPRTEPLIEAERVAGSAVTGLGALTLFSGLLEPRAAILGFLAGGFTTLVGTSIVDHADERQTRANHAKDRWESATAAREAAVNFASDYSGRI